jgi:hypothetical protein
MTLSGQKSPAGVAAPHPSNPLRTNRKSPCGATAYAERFTVAPQPPLAWIFVKPASGARRIAWVTNNTLNVSRASLGAPVGRNLCKTVFRGSPCYRSPTTRSTFRVRPWAARLALIFVAEFSRTDQKSIRVKKFEIPVTIPKGLFF